MRLKPIKREFMFPEPVVLVSTQDENGVRNVAPYSNVTPLLRSTELLCIASWHRRDTLKNLRGTGEFVVNVPGVDLIGSIIPTARHYPPEVDEFEAAGLVPRKSAKVAPPGIEGCLAWAECKLVNQYVEKEYVLVVGKVVHLEMADAAMDGNGGLDPVKALPLMVMLNSKGMRFVTVRDLDRFEPYGAMFFDGVDPLEKMYQEDE